MNLKKFRKRLVKYGIILGLTLSLSGCSGMSWEAVSNYTDNIESAFNHVRDRNIEYITLMEKQGLLNASQADDWRNSVTNKISILMQTFKEGGNSIRNESGTVVISNVANSFSKAITPETMRQHEMFSSMYFPSDGTASVEPFNIIGDHLGGHDVIEAKPGTFYIKMDCVDCGQQYDVEVTMDKFNTVQENLKTLIDADGGGIGKPFELYDSTQVGQLKDALSRPVYVINNFEGAGKSPEKLQLALAILQDDKDSAEEIMTEYGLKHEILGKCAEEEYNAATLVMEIGRLKDAYKKALEEYVLSYCSAVKDKDGNAVTFLKVEAYKSGERIAEDGTPYIFADTVYDSVRHIGMDASAGGAINGLGRDLAIASDNKVSILVRFMEFNPELLEALEIKESNGSLSVRGKYYVTTHADKAAIKLEYPLYKIDSIKTSTISSKDWWCTIADTGMYMDISDGSFYDDEHYRINYRDNFYSMQSVMFWESDRVDPRDSDSKVVTDKIGEEEIEVQVRPLVLKEYVELYQIMDSDGNGLYVSKEHDTPEYWSALGRRLRIKKFSGGEEDISKFAQSLYSLSDGLETMEKDADGNTHRTWDIRTANGRSDTNPNYIGLNTVADRASCYGYLDHVMVSLGLGIDNFSSNVEQAKDGTVDLISTLGHTGINQNINVTDKEIKPIICMGSNANVEAGTAYEDMVIPLAQDDHDMVYKKVSGGTYQCPTVYGICLNTSIAESNLAGGVWIGDSEITSHGVKAWNKWLKENRFEYQVDIVKLLELLGVYSEMYEESDHVVTIDKELLELIHRNSMDTVENDIRMALKTGSVVLGVLISIYGMLLMGAWAIDVNIYGGPKILTFMTGGVWIAVRDLDDCPELQDSGKQYIDLRRLIFAACGIMAVGSLLSFVDIYDILGIAKKFIGPLMETIRKLLIG